MNFRAIEFGSLEYEASLELRQRYLREPLGLDLTAADVVGEESQNHFGLFDDVADADASVSSQRLIASLIAAPVDSEHDSTGLKSVRFRQVVVDAAYRGRGIGSELLSQSESALREDGVRRFVLFARQEAAGFYRGCGYTVTGKTAQLIGIPHREMVRIAQQGE